MDLISNQALGFGVACTPLNLLVALLGCMLGILMGVLPGIGPVAVIALLLPAAYALDSVAALIVLASVCCGAQVDGAIAGIGLRSSCRHSRKPTPPAYPSPPCCKRWRANTSLTPCWTT